MTTTLRSQFMVRLSGLAVLLVGLGLGAWIMQCLVIDGQLGLLMLAGEWEGSVSRALLLSGAMFAFGIRLLADGHRESAGRHVPEYSFLTPEAVHHVRQMARQDRMNDAVRYYRSVTGAARREAIAAVQRLSRWI